MLHLAGYDHEKGRQQSNLMAAQEARIMAALGWKGEGLIAAAEAGSSGDEPGGAVAGTQTAAKQTPVAAVGPPKGSTGGVAASSLFSAVAGAGPGAVEGSRATIRRAAVAAAAAVAAKSAPAASSGRPKVRLEVIF